MANETEKLTINLGIVELAQIDVLTDRGLFSNRSDFIRTAIRKQLESYEQTFRQQLAPVASQKHQLGGVGIISLNRKTLEAIEREQTKADVSVIGMLVIEKNVTAELFENTVESVSIHGKLIAPDQIKGIIETMNGDTLRQ